MIRVAAIQMTSNSDVKKNLAIAEKWIQEAVLKDARLIVLPEMFAVMGMDQMDKVKVREKKGHGRIQDFLAEQAKKYGVWIVGGTIPVALDNTDEKVHAACFLYDDQGNSISRYDKIHLFDVTLSATRESYHESKTTLPGEKVVVASTPFGKLGLAVCYDIRFPELFRTMHDQGVDMIVLPAAFTETTGSAHWDVLVRARAIENQVYMIAAAQTGVHENGRKTYGHSMIVDPWGKVMASLSQDEGVVVADIDLDYARKVREEFPVLTHRRM
ncbi:MAG TPA: carbon-nitrogen hydrolase family protein [Gammaproteobacteria bacterium]|nr:carbon-nitrogen hydrolase family protein [Gammaproteobacteria bacterium]